MLCGCKGDKKIKSKAGNAAKQTLVLLLNAFYFLNKSLYAAQHSHLATCGQRVLSNKIFVDYARPH